MRSNILLTQPNRMPNFTKTFRLLLAVLFYAQVGQAQTWENHPLAQVRTFSVDSSNNLWCASREWVVNRYVDYLVKFKNGTFTKVKFWNTADSPLIYDVLFAENALWVGTTKGIVRITEKDTIRYDPTSAGVFNDTCVALYSHNKVVYALSPSILHAFREGSWSIVFRNLEVKYTDFVVTQDTTYLTSYSGFYKYSNQSKAQKKVTYYGTYEDNYDHVHLDPQGAVWFHNWWALFRYQGGKLEYYGAKNINGFGTAGFEDFAFDSKGGIWTVWGKEGVQVLRNGTLTTFTTSNSNILSDNESSVIIKNDKVYVGAFTGLSILEGGVVTALSETDLTKHTYTLYDGQGNELFRQVSYETFLETLSSLKGFYVLKINGANGLVETKKIFRSTY